MRIFGAWGRMAFLTWAVVLSMLASGAEDRARTVLAEAREDEAMHLFRQCMETSMDADPDEPIESMSEYELAEWRLSQL